MISEIASIVLYFSSIVFTLHSRRLYAIIDWGGILFLVFEVLFTVRPLNKRQTLAWASVMGWTSSLA
jgi:hypothetical protein